jgi:hypothetical protein
MLKHSFIEKQGVFIDNIIEFSYLIVKNNTLEIVDSDIKYHIFKPKIPIPNILFELENPFDDYIQTNQIDESSFMPPALPVCRLHESKNFKGKWLEPVFNLESRLESYYSSGMQEANLNYLYEFAKLIVFVIEKNMIIMTEKVDSTRKFRILNSQCDEPNYFSW